MGSSDSTSGPQGLQAAYSAFEEADGDVPLEWIESAQACSGADLDALVAAQTFILAYHDQGYSSVTEGPPSTAVRVVKGGVDAFGADGAKALGSFFSRGLERDLPASLLQGIRSSGKVVLPHPLTGEAASSDLSLCGGSVLFLRFAGGGEPFYLVQHNFSFEAVYFPLRQIMVHLNDCLVPQVKLRRLFVSVFRSAARVVPYFQRPQRRFAGVLLANESPYHYFYFHVPALFLATLGSPGDIRLLSLGNEHFYDMGRALGLGRPPTVFPHGDAMMAALAEAGEFTISLGIRPRTWRYPACQRMIDGALLADARDAAWHELSADAGRYGMVLWLGVSSGKRAWHQEVEALVLLVGELARRHGSVLLLVDGWTATLGASKPPGMYMADEDAFERIAGRLPANVDTMSLVGAPPFRKMAWASVTDFFVASHGTASIYVSRMCGKPGVTHISNVARHLAVQQHEHHRVRLVPGHMVADDEVASGADRFKVGYSIEPGSFVQFALEAVDEMVPAAYRGAPRGCCPETAS